MRSNDFVKTEKKLFKKIQIFWNLKIKLSLNFLEPSPRYIKKNISET